MVKEVELYFEIDLPASWHGGGPPAYTARFWLNNTDGELTLDGKALPAMRAMVYSRWVEVCPGNPQALAEWAAETIKRLNAVHIQNLRERVGVVIYPEWP